MHTFTTSQGRLRLHAIDDASASGVVMTWTSWAYPLPDVVTTVSHEWSGDDDEGSAHRDAVESWMTTLGEAELNRLATMYHDGMKTLWNTLTPEHKSALILSKIMRDRLEPIA